MDGVRDLVSLLAWRAGHQPDRRAFTFVGSGTTPDLSWTYAELAAEAGRVAAALRSRCRPGDRALLLYPPGLPYVAAFLGCLAAGVVAVPAYPPLARRLVSRVFAIAADAEPAIALTDAATYDTLAGKDELAPLFATLPLLATDTLPPAPFAPAEDCPETAFLQYTSGSTGTPKGVVVTHANLWHNSGLIYDGFGHDADSCALVWLPPFHDMGLVGGILQPFYGGFHGVLMAPSTFLKRPLSWLQAISRHGATTSGGPNFAFDLCVDRLRPEAMEGVDLSRWTVAFNGAEPLRAATLARFAAAFAPWGFRADAFYPCYGMAESTLIITGGRPAHISVAPEALSAGRFEPSDAPDARPLVSSGRVLGDGDLQVVDAETGLPAAPGQIGELWLTSPSVAAGYWRQDTVPFVPLRTGDLGVVWDGEVFVTGRLKDLIIVDGTNHYPQDLEWTGQQSHPALRPDGGAAFSVEQDGQERVILVHEVQPGTSDADQEAAITALRAAIATHHGLALSAVTLVSPGGVPRTSSGKIQRHACRTAFLENQLTVRATWPIPGQ